MKNFFSSILKGYAMVAACALALAVLIVAVLFWRGALTGERIQAAVAVLRAKSPVPEAASAPKDEFPEKKFRELQRLEDRVVAQMALLKAEQEMMGRKRRESLAVVAEAKKAQADLAQAGTDGELEANLPILSRMDGAGIVVLMKSWDDARFVRHLRALKPAKAAEVVAAIQSDPRFEQEFRQAQPGTKTRAERLAEELQVPFRGAGGVR
jgi:hypothetical protein